MARATSFCNVEPGRYGGRAPVGAVRVPSLVRGEPSIVATPRRVFSAAHAYHINSLSACADGLLFLSADDLRVNLWSLERAQLAFNVVDMKPASLEELTEVITAADFHPTHGSLFAYATSRGRLHLADTRQAALCDAGARAFCSGAGATSGGGGGGAAAGGDAYYADIVTALSDIDFTRDGRLLAARDYLTVKIWDLAMERAPLAVIPVHAHLKPRLGELYENDVIFDKFQVRGMERRARACCPLAPRKTPLRRAQRPRRCAPCLHTPPPPLPGLHLLRRLAAHHGLVRLDV